MFAADRLHAFLYFGLRINCQELSNCHVSFSITANAYCTSLSMRAKRRVTAFAASFEHVFNAGRDACCASHADCDLVRSCRWSLSFVVSRSISVLFHLPLHLVMRGGWTSVVLGCCVAVDRVVLCLVFCSLVCTLGSAFGCTLRAAWVCCES